MTALTLALALFSGCTAGLGEECREATGGSCPNGLRTIDCSSASCTREGGLGATTQSSTVDPGGVLHMLASVPEGIDELLVTATDEQGRTVEARISLRINDVAAATLDTRSDQPGLRFRGTRAAGTLAIDVALPATATSRIAHVRVAALDSTVSCEICEK